MTPSSSGAIAPAARGATVLRIAVFGAPAPLQRVLTALLAEAGLPAPEPFALDDVSAARVPDLAFVDLDGGSEQALAAIRRLRLLEVADSFLPILALSGLSDAPAGSGGGAATERPRQQVERRARAAGADDVLPWPPAAADLAPRLRRLLAARRLGERLRQQQDEFELSVELQQEILSADPDSLYDVVLQAAVRTVAGAEGGSVLVRQGELFRYRAAVGYDLASLSAVAYSDVDMQSWYGGKVEELRRGTPRILTRGEMDMAIAKQASEAPDALAAAGRLQEIATNLYVPVVYRGDILAVLNLENFTDPEAFTSESVAQARYFCAPVATLLHEAHHRMLLAQAARTDALTGLPNRRAFDEGLAAALALADRHGTPFSLLLMDLANFKRINDEAGHGQGDVLLRLFAGRLQTEMRQADLLARWGGDEFTVLLAHTTHAAAVEVARRYARIVASIGVGTLSLNVNIGVATCPEDGTDPAELLRVADRRMYAAKAAGTPLMA